MQRSLGPAAAVGIVFLLVSTSAPLVAQPVAPELAEPVTALANDPDGFEITTFEPVARDDTVRMGDTVPVHTVVESNGYQGPLALHVEIQGPEGAKDLEPNPLPPRPSGTALLVAFWTPRSEGPHLLEGHIHAGTDRIPLPPRAEIVEPSEATTQSQDSVDGSTWSVGIAPGTVLWSLMFMGLAFAATRHKLDHER